MKTGKYPVNPVLLVDDEPRFLESASILLRASGINHIITCEDARKVLPLLARQEVEMILLDLMIPRLPGGSLLPALIQKFPHIPVIISTAVMDLRTAVDCMKMGAADYLVKPVEENHFLATIKRAVELREVKRENLSLRQSLLSGKLSRPDAFSGIVTHDPRMHSVFQYVESIAAGSRPLLITGETGTGKELIAGAVHALSGRRGNFVPVNLAGLDESAFSDTLFGHAKGAFTGADQARKGLLESAADGTLLLDEIGDLDMASQVKLLRLLQDGEYYPLGSDIRKISSARIVLATNKDIQALEKEGKFRRDLYYRLCSHRVDVPPLRQRKGDIPLLVEHFLQEAARALGKKKPAAPGRLAALLSQYGFPGNIRELQGMVFDAMSRSLGDVLPMDVFMEHTGGPLLENGEKNGKSPGSSLRHYFEALDGLPTLGQAEECLVELALERAQGSQTTAAEMLGLTRSALNKRLVRGKSLKRLKL
jgi:DNA-binding NtrC family response regulator